MTQKNKETLFQTDHNITDPKAIFFSRFSGGEHARSLQLASQ